MAAKKEDGSYTNKATGQAIHILIPPVALEEIDGGTVIHTAGGTSFSVAEDLETVLGHHKPAAKK